MRTRGDLLEPDDVSLPTCGGEVGTRTFVVGDGVELDLGVVTAWPCSGVPRRLLWDSVVVFTVVVLGVVVVVAVDCVVARDVVLGVEG